MKTLASLAVDVFTLVERFRGSEPVVTMTSYQLLVRLLKEQCILERVDTHTTQVTVKANKEVPSVSLQNPPDPDAGYNGYKGQGYQMQVAESYGTAEDTDTLYGGDENCRKAEALGVEIVHRSRAEEASSLRPSRSSP